MRKGVESEGVVGEGTKCASKSLGWEGVVR